MVVVSKKMNNAALTSYSGYRRNVTLPTVNVAIDLEVDDSNFEIAHAILALKLPSLPATKTVKGDAVTL